jgi:AraC-like DNA-binding protein
MYARIAPGEELQPFVESIWVQENRACATANRFPPTRVIPTGFVDIAFYYRDRFFELRKGAEHELDDVVVTGPQTRHKFYGACGETGIILVRFWPGMASRLLRCSLADVRDLNVSLGDVFASRLVVDVADRLREAPDLATRVAIVRAFVARHLDRAPGRIGVGVAVREILHSGGKVPLTAIAQVARLSPRQLQRAFGDVVGMRPKSFARIVRLQAALAGRREGKTWAEVAYGAGYSDQSHFVNECRRLTGLAPNGLWRQQSGSRLARYFNDGSNRANPLGTVYA